MTSLDFEGALGFGVGLGAGLAASGWRCSGFAAGLDSVGCSDGVRLLPAAAGVLRGVFSSVSGVSVTAGLAFALLLAGLSSEASSSVGAVLLFLPFDLFLGGMTGLRESVFSSSSSSALAGFVLSSSGAPMGRQTSTGVSLGTGLFLMASRSWESWLLMVLMTPMTKAATAMMQTPKKAPIKCLGLSWNEDLGVLDMINR